MRLSHGSRATYTRYGCRCPACTRANREDQRKANLRRRSRVIPGTVKHGSRASYVNWGCRCPSCVAAHSAYFRDYRERERERDRARDYPHDCSLDDVRNIRM